MSKQAASLDLMLPPRDGDIPAYRWLYSVLREQILGGRLSGGARLPATRDLAKQYGLSRGTVVSAFEQLRSEGYVDGTVGSGTYVSGTLPEELLEVNHRPGLRTAVSRKQRHALSSYGKLVELFPSPKVKLSRAFRANVPALDLFPTTLWAQIAGRRLRSLSMNLLHGCDPLGYGPLRQAVAEYLTTSRGVRCVPEQIAIVAGVQEALDLSVRLLVDPGDHVCMEEPGYPGASLVFKAAGAKIRGVPVDSEGMRFRAMTEPARLIYTTPAHQFPTGITMSLARRLELLEWGRKTGALIFEDDYDSEYRYSGRPIPAMQGLDRTGLVLFAGSFNKVLFPSLRLGYLVIPEDLVDPFSSAISQRNCHAPVLDQAILCDFMTEGHFGRHVRRMREIYAERLSVLLEAARQRLTGLIEISDVEAGLQTVGWLRHDLDGAEAARAAAEKGLTVNLVTHSLVGRGRQQGFQLGFAALEVREIRRGVRELASALESVAKQPLP